MYTISPSEYSLTLYPTKVPHQFSITSSCFLPCPFILRDKPKHLKTDSNEPNYYKIKHFYYFLDTIDYTPLQTQNRLLSLYIATLLRIV